MVGKVVGGLVRELGLASGWKYCWQLVEGARSEADWDVCRQLSGHLGESGCCWLGQQFSS